MNKKLIALAVAAALAPAAAMADSGNVTIYGVAHASVDRMDPDTAAGAVGANTDTSWRVSSNSSRLGFKGTEDLGNGLSAVWQMESSIMLDTGAGSLGARNSFVGLSSKTAGTVLLGRHDTPYKLGTASLDIFADTMGDYNAIVGNLGMGTGADVAFDSRLGNVAAYISPTWSGFHFAGAVVAANESNNAATADGSAYSLTGVYNNGPLFASLSYERAKDINAASTDVTSAAALAVLSSVAKAAGTKLGLGYKFGDATVGFIAERIKLDNIGGGDVTRNAFYLNGSYKMGNNVLKAAYGQANDWKDSPDTGSKQFTIGVDHNLSKRTVAYALYSKMNNDTDGGYGLGGNGAGGAYAPTTGGQDPSVISLGMKHSF
jgi:predicted porin